MNRYEVRTIDADPTSGPVDFHRPPPEPVHYVYDIERDRAVFGSTTHDRATADKDCARRNTRS